jgi:hypothetical protein
MSIEAIEKNRRRGTDGVLVSVVPSSTDFLEALLIGLV